METIILSFISICVLRVADIPGATVEHNKFCVSVHFRNCEADQYDAVLGAVTTTLRGHDELHATRGRKVFEIRPQARTPDTLQCPMHPFAPVCKLAVPVLTQAYDPYTFGCSSDF